MVADGDVTRWIASIADRAPVDWDEAERQADDSARRGRLAALRGIERIAAFSHARWQHFSTLLEQTRRQDASTLDAWLAELDEVDAADLRQVLGRALQTLPSVLGTAGAAPSSAGNKTGETVGAYTLEERIGQGGMGEVWCARRSDGRFESRVAVKLLHLPLVARHGRGRFQREGQILARLRHPHIAQLLDAGISETGQPYLVLEYVDGVSIDRFCDARQLGLHGRIRLFLDVLEAVAHAHTNLVLHRDLKTSNILVDSTGQVKLLDFGVAKLLEDESALAVDTEVTQNAGHAFTPEFAAPEQLQGLPVSTASDVYSAGVVLFLLLTGSHPSPVVRGSLFERMRASLESEPRLASSVATGRRSRELRGDLDNILAKALKKSPAERYATIDAFADDLRRHLDLQPVSARADSVGYRVGKFVRRHRGAVSAGAVAVLALSGLTGWALHERAQAQQQRDEAQRQRDAAQQQTQLAEGFTSVVTSLLSQVGPGGRALTPEELLDRAVEEMEARYQEDPVFLVDMLIRISGRYFDLQNTQKELATLVKAEEVARRANDPELIYEVQINTVETELAAGDKQAAQRRVAEARALLATMSDPPDLDDYLRAEAKVARATGDMTAAVGYLERARALLEAKDATHGNTYPGLLSEIALCQHLAGDAPGAYRTTLAIVELDKRHGREESMPGIVTRATLGKALYEVGEIQAARTTFEKVVPGIGQPGVETLPSISARYGEVLSRLGLHAEAIPLIENSVAAIRESGNEMILIRTRLTLARCLVRAARSAEALAELDTVETAMLADPDAYRGWLAETSRLHAELDLAAGRNDVAAAEAEASLRRHGYPEVRRDLWLPAALMTEARVQLALGQAPLALVTASTAVDVSEQSALDPSRSADVGEALLILARAQVAAGQASEARGSVARAADCLRNGLGADHALTKEAEQLAARS